MRRILMVAGLGLVACTAAEGGDPGCPPDRIWDEFGGRCRLALSDRSTEGSSWAPGKRAFVEATSRWGLDRLGVEGVRLSVADIDGDGRPDLFARRAGSGADDFRPGGKRQTWLLRNVEGRTFEDVTEASGIVRPRGAGEAGLGRPAEVVVWADVNGDGAVDAFTGTSPQPGSPHTSELMLNDGTGAFVLGPAAGPWREGAASVGAAVFLDVDRDGNVDLFVGHGTSAGGGPAQDRLYLNLGEAGFRDVTVPYGLGTLPWSSMDDLDRALAHSNAWAAAACDLDGDGWQDLLVASYGRAPNHLWRGGEAGFSNASLSSGFAFDARQDWTDNESARCHCHLRPDDEGCAGVPPPQWIRCETLDDAFRWNHATDRRPYRLGGNSATTVCADFDGDGHLDLLTTEIVHWDVGSSSDPSELLFNEGGATLSFRRPGGEATGIVRPRDRTDWNEGDMTAAAFDFDNDGRPDVYLGSSDYPGTRGWLFGQQADGTFRPVPFEEGIDHLASHGIAVADFDGDGDLDVVVGHSQMRCDDSCYELPTVRFFENVVGDTGNWIQLDLRGGPGSNGLAVGARVEVEAAGRLQVQEVGGGHGHYGIQHDRVLHFGLGASAEARVTIRWPDRPLTTERFTLQAGYRYLVEQGGDARPAMR